MSSRHEDGTPTKFNAWFYELQWSDLREAEGYGWITRDEIREEFFLNHEWVKASLTEGAVQNMKGGSW